MNENPNDLGDKAKGFFTGYWDALKQHVWLRWVTGIAIFLIIGMIGSATEEKETKTSAKAPAQSAPANQGEEKSAEKSEDVAETPAETAEPEPKPKPKPLSSKEKVKVALDDIDWLPQNPKIKKIEFGSDELTVYAATPEGGLQGASTGDLDEQAGAVFEAVYGDAKYKKTGTVVVFKGGLVDSKTGKNLKNVNTGIYTISKGDAREVDWADEDTVRFTIEWKLYRDFAHPALKQED